MLVSSQENAGTHAPPHSKTQFSEMESHVPNHRGGGNKAFPGDCSQGSKSGKIKIAGGVFTLPSASVQCDLPYLSGHCPQTKSYCPQGETVPREDRSPFKGL